VAQRHSTPRPGHTVPVQIQVAHGVPAAAASVLGSFTCGWHTDEEGRMVAAHQCTHRVDDGDARWLQTLGRQDELRVDERCDGEEEMAGDRIDDGGGLGR
jgi:hypothetical protein